MFRKYFQLYTIGVCGNYTIREYGNGTCLFCFDEPNKNEDYNLFTPSNRHRFIGGVLVTVDGVNEDNENIDDIDDNNFKLFVEEISNDCRFN